MKQYLYFNTYTKQASFFEALNDYEARHYVINHYDISEGSVYESGPEFIQIYHEHWSIDNKIKLDLKNFDSFKIINKKYMQCNYINKFFKIKWSGKNAICYSNKPLINKDNSKIDLTPIFKEMEALGL